MKLPGYAMILIAGCWAPGTHAAPSGVQTITTVRLVEAARSALRTDSGLTVTARVLGTPPDATVPAGAVRLQAHPIAGRWPRARVAVPVVILVDAKPVRTETIWFGVQALGPAWVYDHDAPAGMAMSSLKVHQASVDIAKSDGQPIEKPASVTGSRLKRGVHAGWPLLAGDFEPIPDVDRQSQVTLHVRYGPVRIETMARALRAGNVGDAVPVLVEGAVSPVLANVTGKGVVAIAR